jgi:hypothetical protein
MYITSSWFLRNFAHWELPWVLYVILCDECYCIDCILLYRTVLYCSVLHCNTLPPAINTFAVNNNNNNTNNNNNNNNNTVPSEHFSSYLREAGVSWGWGTKHQSLQNASSISKYFCAFSTRQRQLYSKRPTAIKQGRSDLSIQSLHQTNLWWVPGTSYSSPFSAVVMELRASYNGNQTDNSDILESIPLILHFTEY